MGVIFYHADQGTPDARPIYGVHHTRPDDPAFDKRKISIPEGVEWIEVPEAPDKIPWPVPAGEAKGREHWSVVNTTTIPATLKLKPSLIIPVDPDTELVKAIEASTTLDELKKALIGKTGGGQVKGKVAN